MTLTQYGLPVECTNTTPLTLAALAAYVGYSRSRIYSDIKRGYAPEFGDRTTAGHYLDWLRAHPKVRKNSAKKQGLERELSRLN
jgi:predicted DNA-binding transcriptional regulator AlpA